MKKKLIIDIFLIISLVISMLYDFTGNLWHELIGIISFLIIIIHLIINRKWLSYIIKSLVSNEKSPKRNTLSVVVNSILILSIIILTITGIMISNNIFTFLGINYATLAFEVHKYCSYIMVVVLYIHLCLHLNIISLYISNLFKINNKNIIKASVALIYIICLSLIIKSNFIKQVAKKEEPDDQLINNDIEQNDTIEENEPEDNPPTLEEYLSKLHCQGCHNKCVLTAFRCNTGAKYYEEAKNDYYEEYGNSISYINDNTYDTTDGVYKITI